MEENDLEVELLSLANEFQKETLSISLIPSTLKTLKGQVRKAPLFLRTIPIFLALLVFLVLVNLFSSTTEPLLNITKMVFFALSLITGALFIFKPERMIKADKKMIGRLSSKGTSATPLQETILFRLQGLYFILIAVLIYKL